MTGSTDCQSCCLKPHKQQTNESARGLRPDKVEQKNWVAVKEVDSNDHNGDIWYIAWFWDYGKLIQVP